MCGIATKRHGKRFIPVNVIALIALLVSCTGKGHSPIPRPTAYPRTPTVEAHYTAIQENAPLNIEVNTAASLTSPKPNWFNISYPAHNVTIHLTITPLQPAEIASAMGNRIQRMSLNIAEGAQAEFYPANSPQFHGHILKSVDSRTTPIQFLSTDSVAWLVSGAAYFSGIGGNAPVDSLAPTVQFIERDIRHFLTHLSTTE